MRSRVRVLECPKCGAPLPRRALLVRLSCEYCRADVVIDRWAVKAADYRSALDAYRSPGDEPVVRVEGMPWRLLEPCGAGHATDVFRAERATRLIERAVVKLVRSAEHEALLRNEQAVLSELEASEEMGAAYFSTLLPQRIAFGRNQSDSRLAALFRETPGFVHTLDDICRAYPAGVDPRHIVWLWGRLLELLGWVHRSGWVHGAILPAHVLVDAREHGARLVGWSCAARPGTPLAVFAGESQALYPEELLSGAGVSARSDLTMLAKTMLACAPRGTPAELAHLLEAESRGAGGEDARALRETLRAVAQRCFGSPAFVKLEMP